MPTRRLAHRILFTLLAAGCLMAQGPAQAQEVVLKGKQVTEDSLIDALAVEGPQGSGATRGFKPGTSRAAETVAQAKPAGPGKANLLITFNTGSAVLTAESQTLLDTVARALQSDTLAGLTFRVEGHADARGEAENNRKLSQQRAESVVAYLVTKHGILPERLMPEGKGSSQPLSKDLAAPENRRVTIVTNRN